MRYELRLTAYDCLDQVNWNLRVGTGPDDTESGWSWETLRAGHFPGEGIVIMDQWVKDALVAAVEAL